MNPWIYLLIGLVLEISGTTTMKLSQGFHHLTPSLLIYLLYGCSYAALSLILIVIGIISVRFSR